MSARVSDEISRREWRDLVLSDVGPRKVDGLPGSTTALRLVGSVLSGFYDAKRDRLWCLQSMLHQKTGLSLRQLRDVLTTLVALGWIERERAKPGAKYFYRLTFPERAEAHFRSPSNRGSGLPVPAEVDFRSLRNTTAAEVRKWTSADSETLEDSENKEGEPARPVGADARVAPSVDLCDCRREKPARWSSCGRCLEVRAGLRPAPEPAGRQEESAAAAGRNGGRPPGATCPSCRGGMSPERERCETCVAAAALVARRLAGEEGMAVNR